MTTLRQAALAETEPDSSHATIAEWWAEKQRKPLTDDEICTVADSVPVDEPSCHADTWHIRFARAIEAAHGITGENK